MILATDMGKHFDFVGKFKTFSGAFLFVIRISLLIVCYMDGVFYSFSLDCIDREKSPPPLFFFLVSNLFAWKDFDSSNRNSVILLLQCLLKCADVSNPAKPLPIYRLWTDRVMEEFYQQGDNERQLDLPISPFMDRLKPSKAKCQVGFIDFLTKVRIINFC